MRDILSEKGGGEKKKPKSGTELFRLEEKRFVQGASFFIKSIAIFI
jgi:hypothetical protein